MYQPSKYVLNKHNISLEQWNLLSSNQDNVCVICNGDYKKPALFNGKLVCSNHIATEKRQEKYRKNWETIVANDRRECVKCHIEKKLNEFPIGRTRRDGTPRYAYCKTCHTAYQRIGKLKRLFNLTEEEFKKILEFQNGCCAICKLPPKDNKNLSIDHDHKTGLIRGLLCNWCNRVLGVIRDSLERAEGMANYLRTPTAPSVIGKRFGIKGRTSNKAKTMKRLNPDMIFDRPKSGQING